MLFEGLKYYNKGCEVKIKTTDFLYHILYTILNAKTENTLFKGLKY